MMIDPGLSTEESVKEDECGGEQEHAEAGRQVVVPVAEVDCHRQGGCGAVLTTICLSMSGLYPCQGPTGSILSLSCSPLLSWPG